MVRNWYPFLWASGDHIVEQAVHSIDKQQWAFGDKPPLSATALGGRAARGSGPEEGNIWDHFSVTYEYGDGRRAFHVCRQIPGCSNNNTDHLHGTEGCGRRLECQLRDPRQEPVDLRRRERRH